MNQTIYSVGQINQYIKAMMDQDPILGELCMRGELSNYKMYPSGHHYFSMKDADGAIRCVMFRGNCHTSAVSTGKRHAGTGDRPHHGISTRRPISVLCQFHDARRRWGPLCSV